MTSEFDYLAENLADVEARIVAACARSGRRRDDVKLIWVSKNHPQEKLVAAVKLGAKILGENRVQEVLEKFPLPGDEKTELHFIGRLQKNKIRKVMPLVTAFHSIDSIELLLAVNRIAEELNVMRDVFLQINTSREGAKGGFEPESLAEEFSKMKPLSHVKIVGLMTMGPVEPLAGLDGRASARVCFKELRQYLMDYQGKTEGLRDLRYLSMGMSDDFETAIEEGSHFIRVGTSLFGMRKL